MTATEALVNHDRAARRSHMVTALEDIRRRILHLEMPPGATFTEVELAAELGLSKTPVREALLILSHDDLVFSRPGTGYRVAPITVKWSRQLYQLRALVEGEAAALAATRAASLPSEAEALRQLAAASQGPYDPGNSDAFYAANEGFHLAVAELGRNTALVDEARRELAGAERLHRFVRRLDPASLPRTHAEHEAIAKAVTAGDADKARRLSRDHVTATARRVLEALLDSSAVQSVDIGEALRDEMDEVED